MTDLSTIKFFATKPHTCSYLPEEQATTVFVDPHYEMDGDTYSQLSEFGFRRSGEHVYRPRCEMCQACVPIRIPVDSFEPSRSQKRSLKRNSDLVMNVVDNIDTDEHYALYEKYINARHQDGDMYPARRDQYLDFLTSEWGITRFLEFRRNDQLIAVSVTDVLSNGVSAIYAFFDPDQPKRSLGVFNIVFLTQWAKAHGLPYVYLGYWIRHCQKMAYKVAYKPFQVLVNNHWVTVADFPAKDSSQVDSSPQR